MQLELKPANKLTYKLRLTPQMRLAISLLQMPLVKLKEYVKQLKAKGEENSLVGQIIDKYLPYLEKKRFEFIAKKLSAFGGKNCE